VRASRTALLFALAGLLAGCAQDQSHHAAYDPRVAAPPYHVAADATRKPDLEDDGREAQIPPPRKSQPEPDDPREPWSRNYGSQPPVQRADAPPAARNGLGPIQRGAMPADLPPAFRRQLASALDE
jgi:hypothetical protein